MSPSRPPFPFLVGSERSGTTLFRLMLDAHPDMAIPPESYFIVDLYRRRKRYERKGQRYNTIAVANDLAGSRWFRAWGMPPKELATAMQRENDVDFAEAMRKVYRGYARMHGKSRYGDKTPAYVQHIRVLSQIFPESRFVHLIRDGRNVALSLTEVKWGPPDVVEGALQWKERVLRGRQAGAQLGSERYREARYERLVDEPEPVLREVSAFVELRFDEAMLRHSETASARVPGRADGLHARAATAPASDGRDWRRDMSREDLEAVEAAAGDLLEELGYERGAPDPSKAARQRAKAVASRRARRHRVRRLKYYARGNRRI
ncbi:MAG TPA: sulfotransferase [Actinomycetota bacterium]|nr:sulfotransferase [Actinomycetota bacterium]